MTYASNRETGSSLHLLDVPDMMRERDLPVKEVFPALRHKCAKRFVTFSEVDLEVDLRWGVPTLTQNAQCPFFRGKLSRGSCFSWFSAPVPLVNCANQR